MKFGIRILFILATLFALAAAGSSYRAGEQISMTSKTSDDARTATFKSYRIMQSLKAMAAGYELTMNEFYSTVLEFPAYQAKSAAQKAAIESDLAALADLHKSDDVAELARTFQAMDGFRLALEKAMTANEKDWDGAREALFKLNILSVQTIQKADFLSQSASQHAAELVASSQSQQSLALQWQRITTLLALLSGMLLAYGVLRAKS